MTAQPDQTSNFIFYQAGDGKVNVQVILDAKGDTIWASQKTMAKLFGVERSVVTKHLKNIFKEGELDKNSVGAKIAHTAEDGKTYQTNFYNLDAVISVGYRVNSIQATQFRRWATRVLKEYLIKGFALDDERLKQGKELFGKDYFAELLERIREIRASERLFYQKITDIYTTAIDYDSHSPIYATVQNKLYWAIHQHTAAELIRDRADSATPNMGLTNWKNEKKGGKVLKSDVSTAKNYLNEKELNELNRVVIMYLDFAENMASRQKQMKMRDWVERLEAFLTFNEYTVLKDAGKISAELAKQLAESEYEKFRVIQDQSFRSDFDRLVRSTKKKND